MVPFQPHTCDLNDKNRSTQRLKNLAKKRKWETAPGPPHNSMFDIELLNLQTPLPFDWQRCLDIQLGKIHFYNTRTQKRTSNDPRDYKFDEVKEDDGDGIDMSLDLELNLTSESLEKNNNQTTQGGRMFGLSESYKHQKEMVAAVCISCHLLVMMCKSSPECPNCIFINSPDQTPPPMFKRRFHLSW